MATPQQQQPRGALIVFEGIDRCGKTTQSAQLVEHLNLVGVKAIRMRFPDRTSATGKIIDQYLTNATEVDDHAIHLLFSANRWEAKTAIVEALQAGTTVVVDRYAYSGVAYTAAKAVPDSSDYIELEWLKSPDVGLPAPDIVLYLRLSVADAMQRGHYGAERYEKEEMLLRVKDQFERVLFDKWCIVEANLASDVIQVAVQAIAHVTIAEVSQEAIKYL